MKIAVDALGIHYYGGGRSATLNLLKELCTLSDEHRYRIFLTQPEPELCFPGKVEQVIAPVKNRLAVRIWAQAVLPIMVQDCDLVHFMKNLGVFGIRKPNVVTMYDLTTLVHQELMPKLDVWYWKTIQRHTLHSATRIIAISFNTAQDILKFYSVPADKIDVIYPAFSSHFKPAASEEIARVRAKYNLTDSYILHVGRLDKKKNASQIVQAFYALRNLTNYSGKLVFVGENYAKSIDHAFYALIYGLGLTEQVIFTGAVPDKDLPAILSGAEVAVMTSLHEGFGIVALESMACGAPIIANRAGAVHEVIGDAGILLEGRRIEDLVHALTLVIYSPQFRKQMIQRGLERASAFSWRKAALETLDTYRKTLHSFGR
ncbi:glycosyltransferase family 4 protein [Caldilinea sp.]|uniref:glycosyltransferase family 4 protein n=1 Tax=Caldilinea sp. TaxID=2293560 RepID=UPI002615620B|nr:glycosyltransferase family 1 protein [uncultured Caldilinea sp.]